MARITKNIGQIRHEKLLKGIIENQHENVGKRRSLGEIVLNAGYSASTARTPSRVIDSQSFQDFIEGDVPASLVAQTLKRNLQSRSGCVSNKAIDIYIRIKGYYQPARVQVAQPETTMTDEEIDAELAAIEKEQRKRQVQIDRAHQSISSEAVRLVNVVSPEYGQT